MVREIVRRRAMARARDPPSNEKGASAEEYVRESRFQNGKNRAKLLIKEGIHGEDDWDKMRINILAMLGNTRFFPVDVLSSRSISKTNKYSNKPNTIPNIQTKNPNKNLIKCFSRHRVATARMTSRSCR